MPRYILMLGLALLVTTQLPRKYTATTLMVVDSRDSQLLGFQPGLGETLGNNANVDTEVEIARSSKVLTNAAVKLDLANSIDFQRRTSVLDLLSSMLGIERAGPGDVVGPRVFADLSSADQADIVDNFSKAVEISRLGFTSVISISATMSSPEGAALAANALADAYLSEQIEAKLSSNERAASFLQDRVASLARDIADGETALDNFIANKVSELGTPAARDLYARLSEEEKRRAASGAELADLQASLDGNDYLRLAQMESARDAGLAARRAELVNLLQGGDDAAQLDNARRQLDDLDAQLRDLAARQVGTMEAEISASNAASVRLRNQVGVALADLQLPHEISVELYQLQRGLEARRTLYDSYISKLQQVEQQADFKIPDSRIIAPAVPPARASFPPTKIIIAAVFLLSLGLGVALAFLREHFVGGITTVEQFENLTGIPVIATVPQFTGPSSVRPDLAIVEQPLSSFAEGIRRMQLGIVPLAAGGSRCLFVTSGLPGDGKTTLALSLARQCALTGSSTLLIDADLRRPRVAAYLSEETGENGLLDYLSGHTDAESLSIVSELSTKVNFILGSTASNGSTDALLMSTRFDDLIRFARERYETVIIDTPPVGLVVDATIIARHCDAGIFVARYAATSQRIIRESIRELKRAEVPIYGVLNMVARAESYGYYGKHNRYYQSGTA